MKKQAKEAIDLIENKLTSIDNTLTRRSIMREEHSVSRYFHDDEHIKEIDRSRRKREVISESRTNLTNAQTK